MKTLSLEPLSAAAFEPYGQVLSPRPPEDGRQDFIDELQNSRAGARARLSLAAVKPDLLPLTAAKMERHIHSSQAFVPVDCDSYLVLVAPHGIDGLPDTTQLRAFRVPGDTGINYKANIWHYPITALEREARFVVLTFVDGTPQDDQMVPLPEPITIEA